MPNKFFEYMAAGIPVIVYKADAVAELVNKHGLGVVLDKPSDVKHLDKLPYDKLVENVLKFRKENSLEGQRDKLERIYLDVLDTENFEIGSN
jgi:glycosyltransferase involved in cell wall biosynthesis